MSDMRIGTALYRGPDAPPGKTYEGVVKRGDGRWGEVLYRCGHPHRRRFATSGQRYEDGAHGCMDSLFRTGAAATKADTGQP